MPDYAAIWACNEALQSFNARADALAAHAAGDADGTRATLLQAMRALKELQTAGVQSSELEDHAAAVVGTFKGFLAADGAAQRAQFAQQIRTLQAVVKKAVTAFLTDGAVEDATKLSAEERQRQQEEAELARLRERIRQKEQQADLMGAKEAEQRRKEEEQMRTNEMLRKKEAELIAKAAETVASSAAGAGRASSKRPAAIDIPTPQGIGAPAHASPRISASPRNQLSPRSPASPAVVRAREAGSPYSYSPPETLVQAGNKVHTELQSQLIAIKLDEFSKSDAGKGMVGSTLRKSNSVEMKKTPSSEFNQPGLNKGARKSPSRELPTWQSETHAAKVLTRHYMEDYDVKLSLHLKRCKACKDMLFPGARVLKCQTCGIIVHSQCFTSQVNDFVQCQQSTY
eukprot:Unigene6682_Nuclearia_a/m.20504 Unigene6682_Nuclearia_a/g.20504  ORF Unigene6682_Nuclearia_a/g.20504 Unigene6682_Nuclearia_a/m.20504 type:complete len:400 (+) Unigene6682_Nuclearia_a:60-1259(+)